MRPNDGSKKVCVRIIFATTDQVTRKSQMFVRFVRVWAGIEEKAFAEINDKVSEMCKTEKAKEVKRLIVCNEFEPKQHR